jgi:transcriptional regulator with XRE-family HTH domain
VVREIDVRLKDSGVTESLVSAWELGKHRTSARYRAVLCEVFNLPPEALFVPIRIMKLNPRWGEWRTGTLDLAPARSERTWSVTSISFERHY